MNSSRVMLILILVAIAAVLAPTTIYCAPPSISGTIRNSTGEALTSAYVELYEGRTNSRYTYQYTSSPGEYSFSGIPVGEYTVRASRTPYKGQYYGATIKKEDASLLTLGAASELTGIDITLPDGLAIRGTIRDASGVPLSYPSVYTEESADATFEMWWTPKSNTYSDGTYAVLGLHDGNYNISASKGGYVQQYYNGKYSSNEADSVVVSGTDATGIDFYMLKGGELVVAAYDKTTGLPVFPTNTEAALSDEAISAMVSDVTGNIWIGTSEGVTGLVGGATKGLNKYNAGLPGHDVSALASDLAGNLYIGTDSGLAIYNPSNTTVYTTANSHLPNDEITALVVDGTGDLWIGFDNGDLSRLKSGIFTVWDATSRGESIATPIKALAVNPVTGVIWIGCNTSANYYDGVQFNLLNTGNSDLPGNSVMAITCTPDGNNWIATTQGVLKTNLTTSVVFTTSQGLPGNFGKSLYAVDNQNVWVGTTQGAVLLKNEIADATYTTNTSPGLSYNNVQSLLVSGSMVLFGEQYGLDILEGGAIRSIDENNYSVTFYVYPVGGGGNHVEYVYGGVDALFDELPSGQYTIYAYSSTYGNLYYNGTPYEQQATVLTVTQGERYPTTIVFEMEHPGSISGTVKDGSGNDLSGANIYAIPVTATDELYNSSVNNGQYSIGNLSPGSYYVYAKKSSYPIRYYDGVYLQSQATPVLVEASQETSGVDVVLLQDVAPGSISGTALDVLGNPFAYRTVTIQGTQGSNNYQYTQTDCLGQFHLDNVEPAAYLVSVSLYPRPPLYYPSSYTTSQALAVGCAPGANVTGINIVAPANAKGGLEVTVVDVGSSPIAGAALQLSGVADFPVVITDALGKGYYSGVYEESDLDIRAEKSGCVAKEESDIDIIAGATTQLELVMTTTVPGTSLAGVVYNASGNRVWDVYISLYQNAVSYDESVYTDWNGDYGFTDMLAGSHAFNTYMQGYDAESFTLDLSAGVANIRDVTLDFSTSSNRGAIWGHVYDVSGQIQPGIRIGVKNQQTGGTYTAYSDKMGHYCVPNLPGATYRAYSYTYPDYASPEVDIFITPGLIIGDIDITHTVPLGRISGTVYSETSSVLPYPEIDWRRINSGDSPSYSYSDGNGDYTICGVRGGRYKVSAEAEGYPEIWYDGYAPDTGYTEINVEDGTHVTGIDFYLPKGGEVSGRITDAFGHALSGIYISLQKTDASSNYISVNSDNYGYYRFKTVHPDQYHVSIQSNPYPYHYYNQQPGKVLANEISVVAQQNTSGIDFMLHTGSIISGSITNASGTPYTSGNVYAFSVQNLEQNITSDYLDSSGSYTLGPLMPGQYYVLTDMWNRPNVAYVDAYSIALATPVTVTDCADAVGIDITVPDTIAGCTVTGTITRISGSPYSDVRVDLIGVDGNSLSYNTNTSSNGSYTFTDKWPGAYTVSLSKTNEEKYYYGGTYDQSAATRIYLSPDDTASGIDIQEMDVNYASFSGTVRDTTGDAISGAYLELENSTVSLDTYSAADGSYSFSNVFPGTDFSLTSNSVGFFEKIDTGITLGEGASVTHDVVLTPFVPCVLQGTVVSASGILLSNVSIDLENQDINFDYTTYTDSSGEYYASPLPAGNYNVYFSKNGFAQQDFNGYAIAVSPPNVLNVTLDLSSTRGAITGTVQDASGAPVFNVYVVSDGPSYQNAYTDINGRYLLANLSAGTYRVYAPNELNDPEVTGISVSVGAMTDNVDIDLEVTYSLIRGRITNMSLQPIANANVNVSPNGHSLSTDTATANAAGDYIISRVRTDGEGGRDYFVYASSRGYAKTYYGQSLFDDNATSVHLDAGSQPTGIDISMPTAATISGTVTDSRGQPIQGSIQVASTDGSKSYYAQSNASGSYTVDQLPYGSYTVYAYPSGYIAEYWDDHIYSADADIITLVTGQAKIGVDFELIVGGRISGTVKDASGDPYPGSYNVTAFQPGDPGNLLYDYTSTGQYEFENMPPGSYYIFMKTGSNPTVFHPTGFSSTSATIVSITDEEVKSGRDITIPDGPYDNGSISGVMYRNNGTPYTNVSVRIFAVDGSNGGYSTKSHNQTGAYSYTGLKAGSYVVGLAEEDYPPYFYGGTYNQNQAMRIAVLPGSDTGNIDITAPLRSDDAVLYGVVVDETGSPIFDAEVEIEDDNNWSYWEHNTDYDGSFSQSGIYPGVYNISANMDGYLPYVGTTTLAAGEIKNITLTLNSFHPTMLAGQATNASGILIAGVYVVALNLASGDSWSMNTDDYGSYLFSSLPPGTYDIQYSKNGYDQVTHAAVVLPAGQRIEDVAVMYLSSSRGTIMGTVRDASGQPAYHVYVRAGNGTYATTYTDEYGRYCLVNLNAGSAYRVYLQYETGQPEVTGIQVVSGSITEGIDLNLTDTYGTIRGRVTDGQGDPIFSTVELQARYQGFGYNSETVRSGSEGYYRIGRIGVAGLTRSGSYAVRAQGGNYVCQFYNNSLLEETANVLQLNAGGHHSGIDFTMQTGAKLFGRIVNATGDRLSNALIEAQWKHALGTEYYSDYTDSLGNFIIDCLPGTDFTISFSKSGYLKEYFVDVFDAAAATPITLATGEAFWISNVLPYGGVFNGVVRDATGDAVTGSGTVWAYPKFDTTYSSKSDNLDAEGKYEITGLFGGPHTLYISAQGYLDTYHDRALNDALATIVHATPDTRVTTNLTVLNEGTISGKVVSGTGAPVDDGWVYAYRESDNYSHNVRLDATGEYRFTKLRGDDYRVRVNANGFVDQYWLDAAVKADATLVTLATGTNISGIDFTLSRGGGITGTVKDDSSTPYNGVSVYLAQESNPIYSYQNDSTDSAGEYEMSRIFPGRYYVYTNVSGKPRVYYPNAYSLASASLIEILEGVTLPNINFTVPAVVPSGTIAGSVKYPDGTPCNCSLYIAGVDGYSGGYHTSSAQYTGMFTRTGMNAGSYSVRLTTSNRPYVYYDRVDDEALAVRIELRPGETVNINITYPADKQYASVSGTVRDELGAAVGGALIKLWQNNVDYSVYTRADGSYLLSQVYPGRNYFLSASKSGCQSAQTKTIDVAAGTATTGQDFVLASFTWGALAGTLTNQDGYRISSQTVYVNGESLTYSSNDSTDHYGIFHFDCLPVGTYKISASPNGYDNASATGIVVVAGNTATKDLVLTRHYSRGTIKGTVRDASGHPVYRVRVRSQGSTNNTSYTDFNGKYSLDHLNANNSYRVYLPDESGTPEVTGIAIANGSVVSGIDFDLGVAYGTIAGTVLQANGQPREGISVSAKSQAGGSSPPTANTDYAGKYVIPRVLTAGVGGVGLDYKVNTSFADGHTIQYYDHAMFADDAQLVHLNPGSSVTSIDFDLVVESVIAGRVIDTLGDPVVNCYMQVENNDRDFLSDSIYTDQAGYYSLGKLQPGNHSVLAKYNGLAAQYYAGRIIEASADLIALATSEANSNINFTLQPGGSIAGTVRNTTGESLFYAFVRTQNAATTSGYGETYSGITGSYNLLGLPPDTYTVRASLTGYQNRYVYNNSVANGQATALDIVLFANGQPTWTPTPTSEATNTPTATPTYKPLDIFGGSDGVNNRDVLEFSRYWRKSGGNIADINGDGTCDDLDLLIYLQNWKSR
jgi:protocatechuate 3,4-dioxygenase beta subunit